MPVPSLPPARWRLSSIALAVLYFGIALSQLASAAELESSNIHDDHNHHRLHGHISSEIDWGASLPESTLYESQFSGSDRSLIGRAEPIIPLTNDVLSQVTIAAGQIQYFVFANSSVWSAPSNSSSSLPSNPPNSGIITQRSLGLDSLEFDPELDGEAAHLLLKRQAGPSGSRTVYISVNVCSQPSLNGSAADSAIQPMLYVSTTSQMPGPGQSLDRPPVPFVEGFVNVSISASSSIFIGVASPNKTSASQPWTYTISASVDNYFQNAVSNSSFTFLVDADSTSALVSTYQLIDPDTDDGSLFSQWMNFNSSPPFTMLVFSEKNSSLSGLNQSYCAMSKMHDPSIKISMSLTNRNVGQSVKQQFFIENLQPGTSYYAVLAYLGSNPSAPSGTIGGGGQVWQPLKFTTNSGNNCKLIYDLPFCSDVAYAVPANSSSTVSDLVSFYDSNAQSMYQVFNNSIQQISCNTTDSAKYSLVSTCDDCSDSYKTWLCAVTIPRCEDLSTPVSVGVATMPRSMGNASVADLQTAGINASYAKRSWVSSSRNPLIDQNLAPGPYKELLPCANLCYDLARTCPTVLAFSCPAQTSLLSRSYGIFNRQLASTGTWTCNFLGQDPDMPVASRAALGAGAWFPLLIMAGLLHLVFW